MRAHSERGVSCAAAVPGLVGGGRLRRADRCHRRVDRRGLGLRLDDGRGVRCRSSVHRGRWRGLRRGFGVDGRVGAVARVAVGGRRGAARRSGVGAGRGLLVRGGPVLADGPGRGVPGHGVPGHGVLGRGVLDHHGIVADRCRAARGAGRDDGRRHGGRLKRRGAHRRGDRGGRGRSDRDRRERRHGKLQLLLRRRRAEAPLDAHHRERLGGQRRGGDERGELAVEVVVLDGLIVVALLAAEARLEVQAGGDHEGAEDHGVEQVPHRREGEEPVADVAPDRDGRGDQQEGEEQHLRDHEVERRALLERARRLPADVLAPQDVEQRLRVDGEGHGGKRQRLPLVGPEREPRERDLHRVEARVVQRPLEHRDRQRHGPEVEEDLERRHQQQRQGRDAGEVERCRGEVLEPLVESELGPAREQRVGEEDLEAAGGPPELLLGEGLDVVGRVAHREDLGDEDRLPAALVHHERRPDVLRLRVRVDAVDVEHGLAPEHHVGAHAERGVEAVLAWLDEAIEDRLHVGGALGDDRVRLVAVALGGLHERELGIDEERKRVLDEVGPGDEVRVEHREALALGERQRVVDVARLRAVRAQAADVAHADAGREVADVVAAAIVEDPGAVLAAHVARGGRGALDHLERLAVHRDEDVHHDRAAAEQERPRGGVALEVRVKPGTRLVHRERPGVLAARKDGPHRHERVEDQHQLRRQHHDVRQRVSAVVGVEQEERVREDPDGRDDDQRDEHRRLL